MKRSELTEAFPQVSSTAILLIDDEWQLVGKWCRVTYDGDGVWDIWICNPSDIPAGLSQRKVTSILSRIKVPTGTDLHELTGEAWVKIRGRQPILDNLALLGIKKKRVVSGALRASYAERLKERTPRRDGMS